MRTPALMLSEFGWWAFCLVGLLGFSRPDVAAAGACEMQVGVEGRPGVPHFPAKRVQRGWTRSVLSGKPIDL